MKKILISIHNSFVLSILSSQLFPLQAFRNTACCNYYWCCRSYSSCCGCRTRFAFSLSLSLFAASQPVAEKLVPAQRQTFKGHTLVFFVVLLRLLLPF